MSTILPSPTRKTAVLYRMVMDEHVCPYGLKSKDLLEREGFAVDDNWLTTRVVNVGAKPGQWGGVKAGHLADKGAT